MFYWSDMTDIDFEDNFGFEHTHKGQLHCSCFEGSFGLQKGFDSWGWADQMIDPLVDKGWKLQLQT